MLDRFGTVEDVKRLGPENQGARGGDRIRRDKTAPDGAKRDKTTRARHMTAKETRHGQSQRIRRRSGRHPD